MHVESSLSGSEVAVKRNYYLLDTLARSKRPPTLPETAPRGRCELRSHMCIENPRGSLSNVANRYFFRGGCEGRISMRLASALVGNLYRSITALATSSPVSFQACRALEPGAAAKSVSTLPGIR